MVIVGVPAPAAAQYGYLATELILSGVMAIAHRSARRG
jgi:hypothetical protein